LKSAVPIKMSEHHEHTEFLKHCLRYDASPERHAMMEKLTRLQRDLRIAKRASWLIAILLAFALISLAYPAIFVQNFPYDVQPFIMNIVLAMFAGLSLSLFAFVMLAIVFYKKLHSQREECRQLLMRLFAERFDSTPKE
jgi:hypothetical protein